MTRYLKFTIQLELIYHDMQSVKKSIGKRKKSRVPSNCMHFSSVTDVERGEVLCSRCGLVLIEKTIDNHQTFSKLSKDGTHVNTGSGPSTSLTMYDKGLYTMMGNNIDSSGHMISGKAKSTFTRLKLWDQRSKSDSLNRTMGKAFTTLDSLRVKLGIPESTSEKAAYIYRKAIDKKLGRGRSVIPLITASLYVACRESGITRSLNDLAIAANVRRRILSRTVRAIVKSLELNPQQYDEIAFISKICNTLSISEKTKRGAVLILKKLKASGVSEGKNPVALAAASVYLSNLQNNEQIVQNDIARTAGVSAVTVRNRTFEIKKILKL